jgi:hypothetical protein
MARNITLSSSDGSANSFITESDVTRLVQDNTDWFLLKRYELTSNITNFTFPAADFDFANNWSWKMVFPNNYKHAAGHMYWYFPSGSCAYHGRNIANGGVNGNNASEVYCTTESTPSGANMHHVAEMDRDSNNHRWQLKFETGMGLGGGYWNNPTWGYATLEGGTPANIRSNGMTLSNCGIGPSANANNYIYLYGSNTTKGAE